MIQRDFQTSRIESVCDDGLIIAIWFNKFASFSARLHWKNYNPTICWYTSSFPIHYIPGSSFHLIDVHFECFPPCLRISRHLWLKMCTQTWYVWSGSDTHAGEFYNRNQFECECGVRFIFMLGKIYSTAQWHHSRESVTQKRFWLRKRNEWNSVSSSWGVDKSDGENRRALRRIFGVRVSINAGNNRQSRFNVLTAHVIALLEIKRFFGVLCITLVCR